MEPPTTMLTGSGLMGLAGYAGLRLRIVRPIKEFEPTEREQEFLDEHGGALSFIQEREGKCPGVILKGVYFGIHCGPIYGSTYEELMEHFHEFKLSAVGLGLVTLDYPGRGDYYDVGLTRQGEKLFRYYSKTKSKE